MFRRFIMIGSICAFLAVALGAFGAHVLKPHLSADMMAVFETGVHYHMMHALGILLIAILAEKFGTSKQLVQAGWALFIGIILFSGSLYVLAVTGIKVLGAITPLGGVSFLYGWLMLFVFALKRR